MKKPNGYWTKERIFKEARKYQTSTEFKKGCKAAYQAAQRNGLLKAMTWFVSPHKPNGYWTKERVFAEARKYKARSEFEKGCGSAYNVARKNDWLKEMTWLVSPQKPSGYWNYEHCYEEAKKYKTKTEFQKCCKAAYQTVWKNGWLSEMTWLVSQHKPNGYWTKERVFKKAKEYQTRSEFGRGCSRAYDVARKNDWLKEMTWLVDGRVKMLTDKNDSVYKYYWEETNAIYVGRTLMRRQNEREDEHSKKEEDTVYKYSKENGLAVPPMEIIEENITVKEALDREDYWVNYYKEKGYNLLNTAKTGIGSGSIGAMGFGKWTYEACFKKAKEYQTRGEFEEGCGSAYNVARKNKWINDYVWFKEIKKPKNYWSKERVFEEAKKYRNRTEFRIYSYGAYRVAWKSGWLDELFPKYKIAS